MARRKVTKLPGKPMTRPEKIGFTVYGVTSLLAMSFLIYDHFKYKGVDPPDVVSVFKYISIAILLMAIIVFSWFMYVQYIRGESVKTHPSLYIAAIAATVTYFAAGSYWVYSDLTDNLSDVALTFKEIAGGYVTIVTLLMVSAGSTQMQPGY